MDWALPVFGSKNSTAGRYARFEALYFATVPFVRSAVYLISGEDELDDIVQEAYVRAWKKIDGFEARSSVKTWMYRIAVNAARDHQRRLGRKKERTAAVLPELAVQLPDTQTQALIRDALTVLSIEQRETVVLHYFEGLTVQEISKTLETPEGTVKSRLFHGRKAMKLFLKEKGLTW